MHGPFGRWRMAWRAQNTSPRRAGIRKRFTFSYSARVVSGFALTAAMTALITASVLALVWGGQFQTYTRTNMERVAKSASSSLAQKYAESGSWTADVLADVSSISDISSGLALQVVDTDGVVIYDDTWSYGGTESISTLKIGVFPSNTSNVTRGITENSNGTSASSGSSSTTVSSLAPSNSDQVVSESIMVNGEKVGTVRLWAYGTNALLTVRDEEFRIDSFRALLLAAFVAIALASIIGFFFSKGLVNPVKRVTAAAARVKEGDLGARTGLKGADEISQLGQTFDAMATSVEKDRQLERRLTTDVAHELRTPLMAIQATAEAMMDGVLPADEERLAILNSETMRLSRLVDALLKLSRLESGSTPFEFKDVDVSDLIDGLATSQQALFEVNEMTLTYRCDEHVHAVVDGDKLRQATVNLVSNAVRYGDIGGTVCIQVRRTKEDMVAVSVADDGVGIAPDDVQRVFSRFWRADAAREMESGGLGIGLSVVKEIVERHHGHIDVESTLGKGTTFTLVVPVVHADRDWQRPGQSGGEGWDTAVPPRGNEGGFIG